MTTIAYSGLSGVNLLRNGDAEVLDIQTLANGEVLQKNAGQIVSVASSSLSSAVTGANVGGFNGIFRDKTGDNINLKTLQSTNSNIGFAANADDIDINVAFNDVGTGSTDVLSAQEIDNRIASGGSKQSVSTTDATATTIFTITTTDSKSYAVKALITGFDATGENAFSMNLGFSARRLDSGSGAVLVGITKELLGEDVSSWDANVVVSGSNFDIQVQGTVATNIDWSAVIQVLEL